MRIVLALVTILAIVLGPAADASGMMRGVGHTASIDCDHAANPGHASLHGSAEIGDCCPGMAGGCADANHCRTISLAATPMPIPIRWPDRLPGDVPRTGIDRLAPGPAVPPPFEPPRV